MPIPKRYYKIGAMMITIVMLVGIVIVPMNYKMVLLLGWYLLILLVGLAYYQSYRHVLDTIKTYDREEIYDELVSYLNEVKQRGYSSFVFDSYRLYANYMLGDFDAYQQTAKRLSESKAWARPKNKEFREKVIDNLTCIAFLENFANSGQLEYKGDNVLIIQSINDYQTNNFPAIQARLEAYEMPQLKRACLLALSKNFEAIENIYQENELFKRIKERI